MHCTSLQEEKQEEKEEFIKPKEEDEKQKELEESSEKEKMEKVSQVGQEEVKDTKVYLWLEEQNEEGTEVEQEEEEEIWAERFSLNLGCFIHYGVNILTVIEQFKKKLLLRLKDESFLVIKTESKFNEPKEELGEMEENVEEDSEEELEAILYDPNRELGRKVKEEVVESEPKFNKKNM